MVGRSTILHGLKHDSSTGNIPITEDDVAGVIDIFEKYDDITITKKRNGDRTIKLSRNEPDGMTYVAIIGIKKGHIHTKNMWKNDIKTDALFRREDVIETSALTPEAATYLDTSIDNIINMSKDVKTEDDDVKGSSFNPLQPPTGLTREQRRQS